MDLIERLAIRIKRDLSRAANAKAKSWWENYLKGAADFRGTRMAAIRTAVHAVAADPDCVVMPRPSKVALALKLLAGAFTEDKLAGIIFLQEVMLADDAIRWKTDLRRIEPLFGSGHIADWNVCDWLCVKFLGPLIQIEGNECAHHVAGWYRARTLWKRRASAVAFVNLAKRGEANFRGFGTLVLRSCESLLRSNHRFAQSGAGWVLRELSLAERARVVETIERNLPRFTRESLRSATAKLPNGTRQRLLGQYGSIRR